MMFFNMEIANILLCTFTFWGVVVRADYFTCLSKCTCEIKPSDNSVSVNCKNVNSFDDIVAGLPYTTTKLTVRLSRIPTLRSGAFVGGPPLQIMEIINSDINTIEQGAFDGLQHVHTLNLSSNRIKDVSDGNFLGLSQLTVLDLSSNILADLGSPNIWVDLPNLQHLVIDNNNLYKLTEGVFQQMKNLSVISLSRNKIRDIADLTFKGLLHLYTLKLDGNNITSVPSNALQNIESTQFYCLDLSGNPIRKLEGFSFDNEGGKRLTGKLYLNNLDLIPDDIDTNAFVGLSNLSSLYLRHNNLHSPRTEQFRPLRGLHFLALDENPLICDLELLRFATFVELDLIGVSGRCDEPVYLRGHVMMNVPLSQFRSHEPLFKQQHSGNLTFTVGNSATVCCNMEREQDAVPVSWYVGGGRVKRQQTNCLTLKPVSLDDAGVYTCVATTEFTYDEISIIIIVQPNPMEFVAPSYTATEEITMTTSRPSLSIRQHRKMLTVLAVIISTGSVALISLVMVYVLACRRRGQRGRGRGVIVEQGPVTESMAVPLVNQDSLEISNGNHHFNQDCSTAHTSV